MQISTTSAIELEKLASTLASVGHAIDEVVIRENERRVVTKERFNILSCLTKHHREELHSKVIYYLLNPKDSHDCGHMFLKAFLKMLSEIPDIKNDIEDAIKEVGNASVKREFRIGKSAETEDYGVVDILIEFPNFLIGIENKIQSSDQPDQIKRYYNYLNSQNKPFILLYLTPEGKNSHSSMEAIYTPISYRHNITNWLEMCIKESWRYPNVIAGISNYLTTLQSSILNIKTVQMNQEIQKILLKKENGIVLKYLQDISAALVPVRNNLRTEFFHQIHKKLQERGIELKPYGTENVSEIWNQQHRGFYINNSKFELKLNEHVSVFIEIEHDWKDLYYGLAISSFEENPLGTIVYPNEYISITEDIKRHFQSTIRTNGIEDRWFNWVHFDVKGKGLNFDDDQLNYEFSVNMDSIVDDFVEGFMAYVKVWEEYITSKGSL